MLLQFNGAKVYSETKLNVSICRCYIDGDKPASTLSRSIANILTLHPKAFVVLVWQVRIPLLFVWNSNTTLTWLYGIPVVLPIMVPQSSPCHRDVLTTLAGPSEYPIFPATIIYSGTCKHPKLNQSDSSLRFDMWALKEKCHLSYSRMVSCKNQEGLNKAR